MEAQCGEMFNLPDIKNIDWKKVHVGIEKSNFGEGQLLYNNNPPTPQDIKRSILENNQEGEK